MADYPVFKHSHNQNQLTATPKSCTQVVHIPAASSTSTDITNHLTSLLAPGHSLIQQEVLPVGGLANCVGLGFAQQQLGRVGKPPPARGSKAAAAAAATAGLGRGGGKKSQQNTGARGFPAAADAGMRGAAGGETLLLHVHVPELQQMWAEVQDASQQVAGAAAAALDRVAQTFLESYGMFRSLAAAVADLDVLAGFAQVCCADGLGTAAFKPVSNLFQTCRAGEAAKKSCWAWLSVLP
jgi:hypothetical protein